MAIAIVGGCILLQMIYMTNTHSVSPTHPFYGNDTTPFIDESIHEVFKALRDAIILVAIVVLVAGTALVLWRVATRRS